MRNVSAIPVAMNLRDRNGQRKNWPVERGAFLQPAEGDSSAVRVCTVATGVPLNLAQRRLAHARRLNTGIYADPAKIDEQHIAGRM
jgi:hypothetical protein